MRVLMPMREQWVYLRKPTIYTQSDYIQFVRFCLPSTNTGLVNVRTNVSFPVQNAISILYCQRFWRTATVHPRIGLHME